MFEHKDKWKWKTEENDDVEQEQIEWWPFNGFNSLTAVIQKYTSRRVFFPQLWGTFPSPMYIWDR